MAWSAPRVAFADVVALQEALGCPEPMAWVLVRRGLADPETARAFLASDGPLDPPEAIPGIAEAADRLAAAVRNGERIVVHGDYDCDGICSTAILLLALRAHGARVRPFLPSRFTDGYGVALATVERLAEEGCDLLVTVDCGTTAVDALDRASQLGIESIVCDHHLAGGRRPRAIIANPALGRGTDALPAAAGVTFKLTQALAHRMGGDRLAADPDDSLDLVALATVADAVPLVGENRRLVARGLAVLRAAPRPGIAALCAAAGISPRSVDARALGWNLAPAINAAGRMAHPMEALEVLLGDGSQATRDRASALWNLNMERREVEQRVTAEAIAIIEASPTDVTDAHALVVAGEGWHEGVVGIVASRLVDRFARPAIVVSVDGASAKGSGRSLPGIDLHALVASASGPLERWGGHAGAIGLQLPANAIATFRTGLVAAARPLEAAIARARVRHVDAVTGIGDLTLANAEALEALQPFGTGNPEVRLVVPGCEIEAASAMGDGGRHMQIRLRAGGAHARALGWSMGERVPRIAVGERHDVIVQLTVDRWQDLVGPRVTLDGIDTIGVHGPLPGMCATGCDAVCDARVTAADLPALAARLGAHHEPPRPAPPSLGLRDRRGHGAVLATLAGLAGADGGVVAVVADVARRRALLDSVLEPGRLGVEAALLGGVRCAGDARAVRLRVADGRPVLAMVDYDALAQVDLPARTHLALVDPPLDPGQAAWAAHAAGDRWLHLLWGDEETAFSRAVAGRRADVRDAAGAIWRAVRDGDTRAWGRDLDTALFGAEGPLREPAALAAALDALVELGRVTVSERGLTGHDAATGPRLEDTAAARAAAERLSAAHAFLDRAATLSVDRTAISSVHA